MILYRLEGDDPEDTGRVTHNRACLLLLLILIDYCKFLGLNEPILKLSEDGHLHFYNLVFIL